MIKSPLGEGPMAVRRDTYAERGTYTVIYSFIPPPTPAEAAILARFAGIMDNGLATPDSGTRFNYDPDLGMVRVTFAAGLRAIAVDALAELYLLGAQQVMGRSGNVSIFRHDLGDLVAIKDERDDDERSLSRWHSG
jgi:hypothetical protein